MREEEEVWAHANQKEKTKHEKRAKALSKLFKQQVSEPYLWENSCLCEGLKCVQFYWKGGKKKMRIQCIDAHLKFLFLLVFLAPYST